MAEIGADPEALEDLAIEMRRARDRLDTSAATVGRCLAAVGWQGPDAEQFRHRWATERRRLQAVTTGLAEASRELARQSREQRDASEASGDIAANSAVSGGASGTASATPSGGVNQPDHHAPPPPAVLTRRSDPGPPPHGEPTPERVERWELGGSAATGLGASLGMAVILEQFADDRTTVWLENSDGVHATAGIGLGSGLEDGPGLEVGIEGSVGLSVTERQGWTVPDHEVGGLLARLLPQHALDRIPVLGGLVPAGGGIGSLLGEIADFVGLDPGDPTVTETIYSLHAEGGAEATLALPLLGATGLAATGVGLRTTEAGRSVLLHAAGTYDADGGGRGPSGSVRSTVELPEARGGTQPLIATQETTDGGGARIERSVLEVNRDGVTDFVREATRALAEGDTSATGELLELVGNVEPDSVWHDWAAGTVDDDLHELGADVSLGPRLEVSTEGGRTRIDYR